MRKTWKITKEGRFVCHIIADRIEVPANDDGCFYFYNANVMVAGVGSRSIDIQVFLGLDEVLSCAPVVASIEDFYPSEVTA